MATEDYINLNAGEKIVNVYHRHVVNYLPILFSSIVIIIASTLAQSWLMAHQSLVNFLPLSLIMGLLLVLDLVAVLIAVLAYFIYRQCRIILTNQHLIEITQNGLFGRHLSKLGLNELQDVAGDRSGVLPTLFNYGDITIETAAEREHFIFGPVADPLNAAETINDTRELYTRNRQNVQPVAEPASAGPTQQT